ncbi:MAG: cupin domain-containing protein [Azoarcus sp.]|jgi:quercetin dioxygenase-like cupin family protein|nr:cupin domain-containing protein [Azoarcus sp.]
MNQHKRQLAAAALAVPLLAAGAAFAETMTISPNGSRPDVTPNPEYFTGTVILDSLFDAIPPSRSSGAQVTFMPGARSNWHTHPAGQTLIVVSGTGWVQEWGGPRREIRPGDVIWTPPGVKHWHGAAEHNGMRHLAVQDVVDGKNVNWLEKVTDAQYHGQSPARPDTDAAARPQLRYRERPDCLWPSRAGALSPGARDG